MPFWKKKEPEVPLPHVEPGMSARTLRTQPYKVLRRTAIRHGASFANCCSSGSCPPAI